MFNELYGQRFNYRPGKQLIAHFGEFSEGRRCHFPRVFSSIDRVAIWCPFGFRTRGEHVLEGVSS